VLTQLVLTEGGFFVGTETTSEEALNCVYDVRHPHDAPLATRHPASRACVRCRACAHMPRELRDTARRRSGLHSRSVRWMESCGSPSHECNTGRRVGSLAEMTTA
jgi:hypothetical protein